VTNVFTLLGYFGLTLLLAGVLIQLGLWLRCSRRELTWLFTLGVALAVLPWLGEMPLVYFLRGVGGDLSVATVVLIVGLFYRMLVQNDHTPAHWSQGVLLAGILGTLYACTLGYFHYDLYAWGYQRQWILPLALGMMFWAWHYNRALAVGWLAGTTLFALGLAPSRNLWDALFDPYLFLGSLWTIAQCTLRATFRRPTSLGTPQLPVLRQAA
jgi:hypothetical protein